MSILKKEEMKPVIDSVKKLVIDDLVYRGIITYDKAMEYLNDSLITIDTFNDLDVVDTNQIHLKLRYL